MNSLKIPDNGLVLKGSAGKDIGPLPPQAFPISLNDSVIKGMIRCVQEGGNIELALGARPTLHYGSKSHRIAPPPGSNPYDLFITKPFESTREAYQLPLTMGLFDKPNKLLRKAKAETAASVRTEKVKTGKTAVKEPSDKTPATQSSGGSPIDSDIEALQNKLKHHDENKGRSVIVAGVHGPRKGANKAKPTFFSASGSTNGNSRPMSLSPALKPIGSPSPKPLSAAEQAQERSKRLRFMPVHELAVCERSYEYLRDKWNGAEEDFKAVLEKVASVDQSTKKWAMTKQYWKDLDPYMYDYETDEDRQQAIDNAIRQFDKQRLGTEDKHWQNLLPKHERGKGKCLSRLQNKLAQNTAAPPKIKVQRAEESSGSSKDDGDTSSDKVRSGGEPMSRTTSNPLPKSKKLTGQQAQAKRLLSTSKSKASTATATSTPKTSPTKSKTTTTAPKTNGTRPALSQEYVYDSDSSEEHQPIAAKSKPVSEIKAKPATETKRPTVEKMKPKQAAKPVVRPAEKTVEKTVERSITAKPKPMASRESLPPKPATKRPRDDEDSSSSSGTPLSKRIKSKGPQLAASQAKARPLDSRPAPREMPKASKSTSPAKSSPLASSSPTNASDLSEDERPLPSRPQVSRKRKADEVVVGPASKRAAVTPEVLAQARRFTAVYTQYKALHHEMEALENPPEDKVADLISMRDRLAAMKRQIRLAHEGSRE